MRTQIRIFDGITFEMDYGPGMKNVHRVDGVVRHPSDFYALMNDAKDRQHVANLRAAEDAKPGSYDPQIGAEMRKADLLDRLARGLPLTKRDAAEARRIRREQAKAFAEAARTGEWIPEA